MGLPAALEKPPDLRKVLKEARTGVENLSSHLTLPDLALPDLAPQQKASFASIFREAIIQEVHKQMGQVFQEFECLPPWRPDAYAEYEEWLAQATAWAAPTPANFVQGRTVQWVRDREDSLFPEGHEKDWRSTSKRRS